MRVVLSLALLLGASCGGATVVERVPPPPPEPVVAQPSLASFAGAYSLTGAASQDSCAGDIFLAARNIEVDAARRTLFADVIDRTYEARIEDGALLAEGRFPSPNACPGSTLYERWVLDETAPGRLEGTLTSTWLLLADCTHPCTVEFRVTAQTGP